MKIVIVILLALLCGCNEQAKVGIRPMSENVIPTRQDWKDAYGDKAETQLAFNIAVLRRNEKLIVNEINKFHPDDPNEVTVEDIIVILKKAEESFDKEWTSNSERFAEIEERVKVLEEEVMKNNTEIIASQEALLEYGKQFESAASPEIKIGDGNTLTFENPIPVCDTEMKFEARSHPEDALGKSCPSKATPITINVDSEVINTE